MDAPISGSSRDAGFTAGESLSFFFCITLLTLAAEMAAVVLLPYPLTALLLHLAVLCCLSAWTYMSGLCSRFLLLLLVMTAASGPFGAGISLIATVVYAYGGRSAISACDWIGAFLDEAPADKLHERIGLGLDTMAASVEPFQDILTGGTVVQKQMAIAKITRYFRPQFTPLLLQAVQNENAAVRVQAATALARIEREFMAQYMRLEKALKKYPDDQVAKLALAQLCDSYAHTGLQNEDSCKTLREKAIGIYEAELSAREDEEIRLRLARLYLRAGQPEKTFELLKPSIESGDVTRRAILWYLEALFRLKKLSELRRLVQRYGAALESLGNERFLAPIKDVLRAWAGDMQGQAYAA